MWAWMWMWTGILCRLGRWIVWGFAGWPSIKSRHRQWKQSKVDGMVRTKLHTNASSSLPGRMGGTLRRDLLLRVRTVTGLHLDDFGLRLLAVYYLLRCAAPLLFLCETGKKRRSWVRGLW